MTTDTELIRIVLSGPGDRFALLRDELADAGYEAQAGPPYPGMDDTEGHTWARVDASDLEDVRETAERLGWSLRMHFRLGQANGRALPVRRTKRGLLVKVGEHR